MRKFLCIAAFSCLIFCAGCGQSDVKTDLPSQPTAAFVSGMGCSDPNCTDASHHHDCPADCEDYDHHHSCDLDCTDASHHHEGVNNTNDSGQHHTEQHREDNHH